jgi:uncharacterized membrane protein YcaP (DUF421 family)
MKLLVDIFGTGDSLSILQMSCRACAAFLYTLILIRIAGRRSFGLRAPFDNIILILLGAILGRAVVGASAFVPTLIAGLVICVLHRLLAKAVLIFPALDQLLNGSKIPLYQHGKIIPHNLKRSLVNVEDLHEELRLRVLVDSFEGIEAIYMERNGEISAVVKTKAATFPRIPHETIERR